MHLAANGGQSSLPLNVILSRSNHAVLEDWLCSLQEFHLSASPPPHSYQLKSAPALLSGTRNLVRLILKNHRIAVLPPYVAGMTKLEHLAVVDCGVKSTSRELAQWSTLGFPSLLPNRSLLLPAPSLSSYFPSRVSCMRVTDRANSMAC
jgi:hypothetical protein